MMSYDCMQPTLCDRGTPLTVYIIVFWFDIRKDKWKKAKTKIVPIFIRIVVKLFNNKKRKVSNKGQVLQYNKGYTMLVT